MINIIHFEQLWDQSEAHIAKTHAHTHTSELIVLISALLEEYKKLSSSDIPEEVKVSLKKKYLGEIMFYITGISAKDNINVYAALKEQLKAID
jgi:hypothetical protein